MTTPTIYSSYYQNIWIVTTAAADVSESIMHVDMITAIVNCALGLGSIGLVATIGFGRCAKRAE